MPKPPSPRESQIQADIRRELNATGKVRLIRNNSGMYYTQAGMPIRVGLRGSPDLWGTLRSGVLVGIECKRPGENLRSDQAAWWRAARAWGVRGGVAHSVDEAHALLEAALK